MELKEYLQERLADSIVSEGWIDKISDMGVAKYAMKKLAKMSETDKYKRIIDKGAEYAKKKFHDANPGASDDMTQMYNMFINSVQNNIVDVRDGTTLGDVLNNTYRDIKRSVESSNFRNEYGGSDAPDADAMARYIDLIPGLLNTIVGKDVIKGENIRF